MEISVEMMAIIKRPKDLPRKFIHESDEPISIQNLLTSLGFQLQDLKLMQFFVTASGSTEQERVGKRHTLSDLDTLFVTIPVGGG